MPRKARLFVIGAIYRVHCRVARGKLAFDEPRLSRDIHFPYLCDTQFPHRLRECRVAGGGGPMTLSRAAQGEGRSP